MVTGASPLILWQSVGTWVPEPCPRGQAPRRDGPMQLRIAEEGRLATKLWERESIDENADQCTPTLRQLWEGTGELSVRCYLWSSHCRGHRCRAKRSSTLQSVPAQKNRSKSRMRDLPAWAICALSPDSGGK